MRLRIATFFVLVCTFLVVAPAALAHGLVTVRARTSDEIISAMIAANTSGRPTVIRIAPGTYQFTLMFQHESGPSWLPPVTGTMALVAANPANTILSGGQPEFARLVTVTQSGALLARGVTLTQGRAFCSPNEECEERGGGAALNAGGILWLEDSVIDGNRVFAGGFGGGILSTGGHLFVSNTEVTANTVIPAGGGIAVLNGTASIWRSTIRGNSAEFFSFTALVTGGGLYVRNGKVWMEDSTVSGNRLGNQPDGGADGFGAGIYNQNGTVSIVRSAITENSSPAEPEGGARLPAAGGGIYNRGQLRVSDSTIAGNTIGSTGGGLSNAGTAFLEGVTVARNEVLGIRDQFGEAPGCIPEPNSPPGPACGPSGGGIWNQEAGTLHLARSIVALNVMPPLGTRSPDCGHILISKGYNLIGNTSGCTVQRAPGAGPDLLDVDPRLGELEDNGDPGEAHVPVLAGSPVIDAGGRIGKLCSFRDQLGARRVDGDKDRQVECDIGAIEFQKHH